MSKARKKYQNERSFAIPPGETLRELMDALGMTKATLARHLEWSVNEVEYLLSGNRPLWPETAWRIYEITKVPSKFWLSLEKKYREALEEEDNEQVEWP